MGFLERMLGNLIGGHHGGYRGGHHGGSRHGGFGGDPGYPQGTGPVGGNAGNPCPKCGSANANDARFCRQCGASLAAAECSGCGAELAADARFCGQCGKLRQ